MRGKIIRKSILCVAALAFCVPVLAQETCYQDENGRIVTRRRPGYREVPCPASAQPTQPAPTGVTPPPTNQATTPPPPQTPPAEAPRPLPSRTRIQEGASPDAPGTR